MKHEKHTDTLYSLKCTGQNNDPLDYLRNDEEINWCTRSESIWTREAMSRCMDYIWQHVDKDARFEIEVRRDLTKPLYHVYVELVDAMGVETCGYFDTRDEIDTDIDTAAYYTREEAKSLLDGCAEEDTVYTFQLIRVYK